MTWINSQSPATPDKPKVDVFVNKCTPVSLDSILFRVCHCNSNSMATSFFSHPPSNYCALTDKMLYSYCRGKCKKLQWIDSRNTAVHIFDRVVIMSKRTSVKNGSQFRVNILFQGSCRHIRVQSNFFKSHHSLKYTQTTLHSCSVRTMYVGSFLNS